LLFQARDHSALSSLLPFLSEDSAMLEQWYYAHAQQEYGPFSAAQMKECAASGQIQPGDEVWKQGLTWRVSATKVKGLFAPAAVSTPPVTIAPAATSTLSSPPSATAAAPLPPLPDRPAARGATERDAESVLAAPKNEASPPQPETRTRRVISIKGGALMNQDGVVVRYRKHCQKCSYKDTSMTTMPIRPGTTRVNFFCPKCRKSQQVEVHGVG
jgi:hypothetical protein